MSRGGVENAGVILDDADLDLVAGGYEINIPNRFR